MVSSCQKSRNAKITSSITKTDNHMSYSNVIGHVNVTCLFIDALIYFESVERIWLENCNEIRIHIENEYHPFLLISNIILRQVK